MTKERRLGRGLEALLGRPAGESGAVTQPTVWHAPDEPHAPSNVSGGGGLVHLSVYEIDNNPYQPRREFDAGEIGALADSLDEHGLLQPIVVRKQGERYQLISGERRLRAATKAGWAEIPAQVREADDRQVAELAIVENLQRRDLNALEKAASFQRYIEQYHCTQEELAGRLKVDRSTIANLIRLLELPSAVQDAVRSGLITQGHARALLPLGDDREQIAFCTRIQAENLSVRATEEIVQETIRHSDAEPLEVVSPEEAKRKKPRTHSKQLASLEQELRTAMGTKVDVKQGAKGRGRIVVHFSSHDEFERLRQQLSGQGNLRNQAG